MWKIGLTTFEADFKMVNTPLRSLYLRMLEYYLDKGEIKLRAIDWSQIEIFAKIRPMKDSRAKFHNDNNFPDHLLS